MSTCTSKLPDSVNKESHSCLPSAALVITVFNALFCILDVVLAVAALSVHQSVLGASPLVPVKSSSTLDSNDLNILVVLILVVIDIFSCY